MKISWLFDKDILLVVSSWFSNISAGWLGSVFVLPIFFDVSPFSLLTVNLSGAIVSLGLAIWLAKKGKRL